MGRFNIFFLGVFLFSNLVFSQSLNKVFKSTSPNWVQTNGPGGGSISDIAIDQNNPDIMYAVGIRQGIFKTTNGGQMWNLIPFEEQNEMRTIKINSSGTLFSDYQNFTKSSDGGVSWQEIATDFGEIGSASVFGFDPADDSQMYVGCSGIDGNAATIYKSVNEGDNWTNITGNIAAPSGSVVDQMAILGGGKLLVAIKDQELQTWHKSKLFYSENDGSDWSEIDYGTTEDRFIFSLFVNPNDMDEVWLTEGPLFNTELESNFVFKSQDGGKTWSVLDINDVMLDWSGPKIIGSTTDGKIYLAGGSGLSYTSDGGTSFNLVHIDENILLFDLYKIYQRPNDANTLYLPTDAGGIAFSTDGGTNWSELNNGIIGTAINLIATDPVNPGIVYAASNKGEGTFRSDDYGQNWLKLNSGGIVHAFGDELTVDPSNPDNVWFISDVPYIHKSTDKGNNWELKNHPYQGGNFNFSSVYAFDFTNDGQTFYALNNGFGIFKGSYSDDDISWEFLNLTEVDYSYSIAVDKNDENTIFSGYSRKPFEAAAKVMASDDAGTSWFEALSVEDATAVTSVVIDPNNSNDIYAVSIGDNGADIFYSDQKGSNGSWNKLNTEFNFTTIHSFALDKTNENIAYACVWGGGTYKTTDAGVNWNKLDAEEITSVASLCIAPSDNNVLYAADRMKPVVYRSDDAGVTWYEYFNAGGEYRRLMFVTADAQDENIIYVSAMKMGGPGKEGALFKTDGSDVVNITNGLEKVPLTVTVDPNDEDLIYTVLHESGVFKSTDGGLSWTDISGSGSGLPVSGFNNLVIDPNTSSTLYLLGGCDVRFETAASAGLPADEVNTVYRSTDGGDTWENIGRGVLGARTGAIKSMEFHEYNSAHLFIAAENGVYYSLDAGDSWSKSTGLPFETLGGLGMNSDRVFAFTNGAGVYTGTLNASHLVVWETDQKIKAPIYFAQLLKHPTNSDIIYASAYPGGVFRSDDKGQTWHEKNFGMASFVVDDPLRQGYYAMAISESNPDVMYLGLYKKGVYRSFNAGDTWYPVNGQSWEMFGKKITTLAIDPTNENNLVVGSEEGVFASNDGGESWSEIKSGLSSTDVKSLKYLPSGEIVCGTKGYGMYVYDGASWNPISGFGNFGVIWPMWDDRPLYQYTSTLIHPYTSNKMMIGTFPQGIYKSDDGGDSWYESNVNWTFDGVFELVTHPDDPDIVFSGTYNGLNRSLDWGASWEMWDNGWPDEQWVFSIDFDPEDSNIMYACSKNGENEGAGTEDFRGTVMKSTNGGASWFEITNGLTKDQEYYKIIVDRFDRNTIYLASQNDGMFISKDAGGSWQQWNEGLTNYVPGTNGNNVTKMLSMSADKSILYFGSAGSGVYRRMITPTLPVNNLSAKIENQNIILTWQFDDLNSNFGSYTVYRSEEPFTTIDGISSIENISDVNTKSYTDGNTETGKQYYYAVTTTDNNNNENSHVFVLGPVVRSGVMITTTQLDSAIVGQAYSDVVEASGGVQPYNWSLTSGSLPGGLELMSPTGEVKGTPTNIGEFNFTLMVEDNQSPAYTAQNNFSIIVTNITSIEDENGLPTQYVMNQNYPNPFNPSTKLKYDLPFRSKVKLIVYDILGRLVATVVDDVQEAGYYNIEWNAGNYPSGIYFCSIYAEAEDGKNSYRTVKKMTLLK